MIRILNQDFEILKTITQYTSVEFVKIFNDYGTFTVQIPLTAAPAEIKRNRILQHKNNYGIIRYISQSEGYIVVQGHDLKVLLTQRCVQNDRSGASETVIKEYVSESLSGEGREIPHFNISDNMSRGTTISYSVEKLVMLDEIVREICGKNDWGYDVTVLNKEMHFDINIPRNLDITYSKRLENIKEHEYICDALEERNAVVNYAEWEGLEVESDYSAATAIIKPGRGHFSNGEDFIISEDTTVSTYTRSNNQYTTYIYARKAISSGQTSIVTNNVPLYNTSAHIYVLIATISPSGTLTYGTRYTIMRFSTAEGIGIEVREKATNYSGTYEEIKEACMSDITGTVAESVEAEILTGDDYGNKWKLGDYVKVRVRVMDGDLTVTKQITQVTEIYESGTYRISPVFGPIRETAFKKLARGRL